MKLLLQNLNTVNYIAFLSVFIILAYLSSEHLKTFFSNLFADKRIKGVILKKKKISLREFQNLKENINTLNFRVNELNQSYLLNDNLIDIKKELKEINRLYLKIYLTLQRFKKHKIPVSDNIDINLTKPFSPNKNSLKQLDERLKLIKKILDTLNLDQKIKIEDEHSHALHNLSIIRMTFIPLAVIVTYFKMKFTSMGFDFGSETKGIWTIKYGQTFVWTLLLTSSLLIVLGFHFNILA